MSTATATAEAAPAPKGGGKKKLIIIIAAAVLVLAAAGGGALLLLKSKAAHDEDSEEAVATAPEAEPKVAPTFVPLDPFTVNLADRETERYAQVGVTLAIEDSKVGDAIKTFMPAIRNNILMVLAHKTSGELLQRDGKDQLAQEIRRETARALGYAVAEADDDEAAAPRKKGKRSKKGPPPSPITAVYFSNFIVQ